MAIIKSTNSLMPSIVQNKVEPLSPGGLLLKEKLSHLDSYANKAKGGNDYWNALACSHFSLFSEDTE